MPKPKNKYDREHLRQLQQIQRQIDLIYEEAAQEAASIGASVLDFNADKPFSFEDYPATSGRIDRLMSWFKSSVEFCIVNGISSQWTLANNKNDELANRVFGDNVARLTQEQYRRYYSNHDAAREAFLSRKEAGLNLSDRVWRYTSDFKNEIEMSLDLGIRGGVSADRMSRNLRQYLKHPDMLFRRVRDEHGILHLSKNAALFHPGRGVYRSSYLNARRLAGTETNIAYNTADHLRRQQLDFVVGIEVKLSNNHTCKGRDGVPHPFHDMCDELAGKYPKDFKFVPWHPNCRCYAVSILKTEEEIEADTEKLLRGEPIDGESVNKVEDVPDNFKKWVEENRERIDKSSSLPYFLRENEQYWKPVSQAQIEPATDNRLSLSKIQEVYDRTRIVGVDENDYNDWFGRDFDFLTVKDEVTEACRRHGIVIDEWSAAIRSGFFTVAAEGRGFEIHRTFNNFSEGIEVHHDLFTLSEEYQGKGLSKELFRSFYKQYKNMGVRYISVCANIDVGGYTWARYGFSATSRQEALQAVRSARDMSAAGRATEFIEEWYKKNSLPSDAPFPMRLLTEQAWGKKVLLGSFWDGRIDLLDETSRKMFESYLGL